MAINIKHTRIRNVTVTFGSGTNRILLHLRVFLSKLILHARDAFGMVLTITCTWGSWLWLLHPWDWIQLNFHTVELSTTVVIPLTYSHILNKYNSYRGSKFTRLPLHITLIAMKTLSCFLHNYSFNIFLKSRIWRRHSSQCALRHFDYWI